jgi:hypothetical protein
MSRNPYANSSAGADPYTNGNGYGAPAQAPATSATDDYDPYGDRYGTPPIPSSGGGRDRRAGRSGGYGGFYDGNGSSPGVQTTAQQPQPQNDYGRAADEPAPMRSPRRPAAVDPAAGRRYRPDRGDGGGSGDSGRGAEYRRGAERLNPNATPTMSNEGMTSRNRTNGRTGGTSVTGGDGTRQIEG